MDASENDSTGVVKVSGTEGTASATVGEGTRSVTLTLDEFRNSEPTVELRSPKGGTLEVSEVRVVRDTDGDGLSDFVEQETWRIPRGDGSAFQLDPESIDSDGDELDDDRDVSFRYDAASNEYDLWQARANPDEGNSDGIGLPDAEERDKGSDPLVPEVAQVGLDVSTVATVENDNTSLITTKRADGISDAFCKESRGGVCLDLHEYDDDLIVMQQEIYYDGYLPCVLGQGDCPPAWLSEVDVKADTTYLRIPARVSAVTNGPGSAYDLPDSYDIRLRQNRSIDAYLVSGDTGQCCVIKGELPSSGTKRVDIIIAMPNHAIGDLQRGVSARDIGKSYYVNAFEHIGQLEIEAEGFTGAYARASDNSDSARSRLPYSVALGKGVEKTATMVDTSAKVYEEGMEIASAATTGAATATTVRGAIKITIKEYVKGELKSKPIDSLQSGNVGGIKLFAEAVRAINSDIPDKIVEEGDATVTMAGPVINRAN